MQRQACRGFIDAIRPTRREFLRAGSAPLIGLGLPRLLQGRTAAAPEKVTPSIGRAKACIVLFMWGGPAHQDTWDMKPGAPAEYRGDFKPIATTVPGLQICEHLPRLAKQAHKLTVVRSMTHNDVDHTTSTHFLLTGREVPRRGAALSEDWPSYGAVLSRLGRGKAPLPPFVNLMPKVPNGAPRFVEESHGQGAGWLGSMYDAFRIDADPNQTTYRIADFSLSADVPQQRTERRRELLGQIERQRRALDQQASVLVARSHYERAFALLNSPKAAAAFDLSKENDKVRDRYGRNIHGQAVLQARRLVEAGVPLVTVYWQNDGITNVSVYWDTHNRNFVDLKERLCPAADQAFSALLDDLEQRGMLDETLVLWTGEMGRTPRVGQSVVGGAGAGRDGRDHWGSCFTSVLAGGGIKSGLMYGSSDRFAAYPVSNPTAPADLAATIYHCLGVDPRLEMRDKLGRPLTLCQGSPIQALLR